MSEKPKVSIIILNWNGWKDTIECLESLYQIDYLNYDVIIVDNDSKNDSIQKIKDYCQGKINIKSDFIAEPNNHKPITVLEYDMNESESVITGNEFFALQPNRRITIIKNEKNLGFPEGCNVGMRYALNQQSDYFLLLNNDTVVDKEFLNELINVAESDPQIGILGSKIYFYDNPEMIQAAGGKINWNLGNITTFGGLDKGQFEEIIERDYVYGTSLILKKEVIDKVSLMDPSFFFGVEEYDYCTKTKKAGFKIIYVPKSLVWHKGGASSKNLSDYPSTLEFFKKSAGRGKYKYYYKLFNRHGPSYLFVFPMMSYLIRTSSVYYFFQFLFTGETEKIKKGIKRRLKT
ncbi:glycosyltransferase family 2 protein [uncultured Methanobacterium sp.]|uniref:glycosyltransferase family 2 protein n=1 Tax=uncultured Methanobacterium sp. TaxID=176306 RepID=UPI002AA87E16|nr:glycosyltransferase family 2 protein [uncultured Methanobacterium sp.]